MSTLDGGRSKALLPIGFTAMVLVGVVAFWWWASCAGVVREKPIEMATFGSAARPSSS